MLASTLRKVARNMSHGGPTSPRYCYLSVKYNRPEYWDKIHSGIASDDEYLRVAALADRYRRYYEYCAETFPQWKETNRIYWGDNSIDSCQTCKCGKHTRRVMVTSPHGDLC